ncbi:DUF2695 domain-containing protein [Limnovirga soli]|uniref:DUF2695 domain-containing protein n=1 Tax=Limnovirga soli TaxID=2656915 RepID=A0A8J8JRP3_9BACT|nr:DUF2695 domain-containing protein [Limnovirga soli]NNV53823.1 DUF2695 domain-containing protein [Limnovirga soli]
MPNKSEKERRKQITNDLRKKAREEFEASLPISRELFQNLFDHLDKELIDNSCDHTLKLTSLFLESKRVENINNVKEWLRQNSGYCDCEVLANVEEKFGENPIL